MHILQNKFNTLAFKLYFHYTLIFYPANKVFQFSTLCVFVSLYFLILNYRASENDFCFDWKGFSSYDLVNKTNINLVLLG